MTGFDLPSASFNAPQPTTSAAPAFNFPLTLSFKLIAISNQFEIKDAGGAVVGYVRQPWTKLKEAVTVYADARMDQVRYTINADRILDFGANYDLATAQGGALGQLQRHALKSFFKAHYELHTPDAQVYTLLETNPWTKVLDNWVGGIPVLGWFTGYFLNPRYALCDAAGNECLEIKKMPSFFERSFQISALRPMAGSHALSGVLGSLMMILLESKRG